MKIVIRPNITCNICTGYFVPEISKPFHLTLFHTGIDHKDMTEARRIVRIKMKTKVFGGLGPQNLQSNFPNLTWRIQNGGQVGFPKLFTADDRRKILKNLILLFFTYLRGKKKYMKRVSHGIGYRQGYWGALKSERSKKTAENISDVHHTILLVFLTSLNIFF